jgi:hypothetical protein
VRVSAGRARGAETRNFPARIRCSSVAFASLGDLAWQAAGKPVMSLCAIIGYACLTWCGCGDRAEGPELSGSVTEFADAPEVPPVTALVCATLQ